jgi:hypothetical protein
MHAPCDKQTRVGGAVHEHERGGCVFLERITQAATPGGDAWRHIFAGPAPRLYRASNGCGDIQEVRDGVRVAAESF